MTPTERFENAVRTRYPETRRRFGNLVSDPNVADDLSQEVFTIVYQAILSGREITELDGYIRGVASRVFYQYLRQKKTRADCKPIEATEALAHDGLPPEIQIGDTEQSQVLHKMIEQLAPEDQQVILGAFFWRLSGTQLGEVLGISRQLALHRLNRAVEKLRSMPESRGLGI